MAPYRDSKTIALLTFILHRFIASVNEGILEIGDTFLLKFFFYISLCLTGHVD